MNVNAPTGILIAGVVMMIAGAFAPVDGVIEGGAKGLMLIGGLMIGGAMFGYAYRGEGK